MEETTVDLRILGPVELWYGDQQLRLSRRQQRLLLGILALHANRVVTVDRLTALLWMRDPPPQARAVLQTRMSEIRAALTHLVPGELLQLTTSGTGYALRVAPEAVDSNRFLELSRGARTATDLTRAREAVRAALALWRGNVLDISPDSELSVALCQPLESARLTAVEDLLALELRSGDPHPVANQAVSESLTNPTRERLLILALRSLHAAGRATEALRHYDQWRRWLREEFGVDPAGEIQQLHLALVRGAELDPDTDDPFAALAAQPTGPATVASAPAQPVPPEEPVAGFRPAVANTLPADIADFTGRIAEADLLRGLLIGEPTEHVPVIAVVGPGGVGKTSLAVHVAHRLSEVYRDGQLYVNLAGVEEDVPLPPLEVLGRFLRALGVDGGAIPDHLAERTDLYRSLLANRRVLVVLDNAADEDQVTPLIPGWPGCAVMITSRRRLGASLGATTIPLSVLDRRNATALLSMVAGADRVAAEPGAAARLCDLCGYLPLAIRVAGAKLAAKPHWSVAKLVDLLADELGRLDQFSHGQLDVRASIALSYQGLDAQAQALLRRLGELDHAEYPLWLAAAALDTDLPSAEAACEQLFDAQLLGIVGYEPSGQPRYRLHDLVRLFGREKAREQESPAELTACHRRAGGGWLYLAELAFQAIGIRSYLEVTGPAVRWRFDPSVGRALVAEPLRWFETERASIMAVVRQAARDPHTGLAWELAGVTSLMFEMRRSFDDWQVTSELALQAAQQADDVLGVAVMQHVLGQLATTRTQYRQAHALHTASVAGFERAGDRRSMAVTLAYLGVSLRLEGRLDEARQTYEQALTILEECGDRRGVAFPLRGLGQVAFMAGRYDEADEYFERALAIYRAQEGASLGEAQALVWQGTMRIEQGRLDDAERCCQTALDIARAAGDRPGIALSLRALGLIQLRRGDRQRARGILYEALHLVVQPRPTGLEAQIRSALAQL